MYLFSAPDVPLLKGIDAGQTYANVSWSPSSGDVYNPALDFYVEYRKDGV